MNAEQAKALREPFPADLVGKLPKPTKRDNPKGRCKDCGGWHGLPAVHLDYVGHAAVTDRLLSVDPGWSWQPLAIDPTTGGPTLVQNPGGLGDEPLGLWGNLTVCGVTKPAFGGGKNAKECISDLIRNGAMRFGVGLDLWSKEDLQVEQTTGEVAAPSHVAEPRGAAAQEAPSPVGSTPEGWWDGHSLADLNSAIAKMTAKQAREGLILEGEREMRGKGKPRKTVLSALSDRIRSLDGEPSAGSRDPVAQATTEPLGMEGSDSEPASPPKELVLVKAALAWIADQPDSVDNANAWTQTGILLGISQLPPENTHVGSYGSLEEVPSETLQWIWESAVPDPVTDAVLRLGPEALEKLAAQAK